MTATAAVPARALESRHIRTSHVDGPFGRWTQAEYRPPHLAGMVDRIWYFDGVVSLPRERVFPNGMLELIVQFDEPHRQAEPELPGRYPPLCATGLITRPFVIEAPRGRCRVMGICLHPVGAYALLRLPLSEIGDLTVDLRDLAGRAAAELAERCHTASSDAERVRMASRWLEARLVRGPRAHPAVSWTAAQIAHQPGASIAALRAVTGISPTRLATLFREQVGVTPKRFARLHRFRRALEMLHEGAHALADLALRAGYYDQPHFAREFREMAGLTPSEFLSSLRYPSGYNLPEPSD
jgi:AraC-like DNA-binding protein